MKKTVAIILCLVMLVSGVVSAKNGDIITYTKVTDIIAYINHYAIQSYNVNGVTCVGAEDLANFGFSVIWDNDSRTLSIRRNMACDDIHQYAVPYEVNPKLVGKDDIPVLETDIVTYVNGNAAISYNINGRTVVDFESLKAFGKVEWNQGLRTIKLWVEDGLEMLSVMQPLKSLPKTTLYSADGRTISVLNDEVDDYVKVGWYTNKSEAEAVEKASANKQAVSKFYVGQRVRQNLLVICKYGVVDAIDSASGKVKVYWNEIQDAYGNKKKGMEGMLYGLNNSTWVDASGLTPMR